MEIKKKGFKRLIGEKKIVIISALILIALTVAVIAFVMTRDNKAEGSINPESPSGVSSNTNANNNYQVKSLPLSSEEINKVASTILSSEFVKAVPEKEPISLTFFTFDNGQRIWQSSFLIGKSQLLTSGTPGVSLILHSKYISQLDGSNLCDIIKQANKNGDLGFESKYSTASLFLKYAGMLKYRDCFGF